MGEREGGSAPSATVLGPRLAADAVVMVRQGAGIRLDYSPGSLAFVDRVIEGMRHADRPAPRLARTLIGFGAYTGEVLVRVAGAHWVAFDDGQRELFGQSLGVRTPDGRLWNPLGKAVKRYENGSEDSLRLFCLSAAGRAVA